ncbi:Uncharacterised protein [Escherichia coli]|uniref:Uncharacterized protein n=1 Tax=Escherichia coli TaxID=562 RepID=A0A376RMP3_ECOLX|nr:Uncharacterised protein [Escherichia coli]
MNKTHIVAIIAEVFELERLAEIATTYHRHDSLQIITRFASHTDLIALEFAPALQFAVFNHLDDFLLGRALNALFQFRFHKPGFTAMTIFSGTSSELPSMPRFSSLGTQNIQQLIDLEVGLAQHFDGFAGVVQLK